MVADDRAFPFALEAVPVALVRVSADGRIDDLNDAGADLLGGAPATLLGTSLFDRLARPRPGAPADHHEELRAALRAVTDQPHPVEIRVDLRPALGEGSGPEVESGAVPLPRRPVTLALRAEGEAEAGASAGTVLVAVTDRTAETRAEAILDALADSTLLLDGDGLVAWQSHRLTTRLSGRPDAGARSEGPEQPGIGVNPLERIHPEDLPGVLDAWVLAVTEEGSMLRFDARSRAVDDDDLWQVIEVSGVSQLQNPYVNGMIVQIRNLDDGEVVESLGETDGPLQSLADAAPIGIVMTDPYDRTVYRNRAARDLLEQPELRPDVDWRDLVSPAYRDELDDVTIAARDQGESGVTVVAVDLPSGARRWLRVHVTPSWSAGRQSLGLITTIEDVTAETEAREEADRMTHMLDATSDYVAIYRPGGEILYLNNATRLLLDRLRADGKVGELRDLIDDEPRRAWIEEALSVLEHSDVWTGELDLNAGGGRTIPISALGVIHRLPDGGLDWVAMFGRDITDLKAAELRLRELATHDHLTGLPNRSLFNDRLEQAIARHRRDRRGLAVMFCDLDGFKEINDLHGHAAGDLVLLTIADRLREITRASDTAARVGGDEFVVVCEGVTDSDELAVLAERVIDAVTRPIEQADGTSLHVGISVGVGVVRSRQEQVDADHLLTLADTAMYRAKARGGNTFRIAALGQGPDTR